MEKYYVSEWCLQNKLDSCYNLATNGCVGVEK